MIYIDGIGLRFLISEIKSEIIHNRLTKIYQYNKNSISLFFNKKNLSFLIKDNDSIFYIKNEKDTSTDFQSKFLLSLKKYILNSILINIRQESFDRVVYFDFEKLNQFGDIEKFTLVFEIMGKHSNIFLLENNKILSSLTTNSIDEGSRITLSGSIYTLHKNENNKNKVSPIYFDEESFNFLDSKDMISRMEGIGKVFSDDTFNNYLLFKKYFSSYSANIYRLIKNNKEIKVITYNNFYSFENNYINKTNFDSINDALNDYFKNTIVSNIIDEKKKNIIKHIDNLIKKHNKILTNIANDITKNSHFQNDKNKADILAANLHLVKYGMNEINVFDFYNNHDTTIELDPLCSPKENLNNYYSKYNKSKRAIEFLKNRIKLVENELYYLDEMKLFSNNENDFNGLDIIESELNITKKKKINANKKKKRELLSFEYNNHKILVGRNNVENDEITFSKGEHYDIWLHTKDIPGSHVLILSNSKKINNDTIIYAATLAAQFSKANINDKIEVDYCEKKYVKKIKGAKLGQVTYSNYNTILIDKNQKLL